MTGVDNISHQLMIVVGIPMYAFGSIGNLLSIYVFSIWSCSKSISPRRTSNSSLYLLVASVANFLVIVYPLFTRILLDGYGYSITENRIFLICKLRYYVLHTCDLISLTCICLAAFDRYLISSREVRLRKLSTTTSRTQLIILCLVCLFAIHNLPILKYYTVSESGQCTIASTIYLYYYLYTFQILLHGLVPIMFLSVFGILTFRQLRLINKRKVSYRTSKRGKQLSRMLLLISLAIILSSIPYCIEQTYLVFFKGNDRKQQSYFYLYHVTCSILFYTNPATSFYIYFVSTRNFRRQIRKIFCPKKTSQYVVIYKVKPIVHSTHVIHKLVH